MTKQLLIYDKVVPVNRQAHRDLSVRRTTSFAFAKGLNSVPIVDVEFAKIALEAPIVFAKTETGPVSLALIGVQDGRCAFVNAADAWTARYVPAFLRRYPFVFSVAKGSDKLTLCVDESFEGLNTENRGERLFDADGKATSYLTTVLRFIEEYQATFNRTQAFCDRLGALDLLEEARIDYRLADGKTGGITGFWRVSNEKLRALPDEKIAELFRAGDLDLIQLHMLSMHNAERLINQALAGQPAPTATPAEAEEPEAADS